LPGPPTARVSTDKSAITYHLLNTSRGPAAWGPRAQMSRVQYRKNMQSALAAQEGLSMHEGSVESIVWDEDADGWKVKGVRLGASRVPT